MPVILLINTWAKEIFSPSAQVSLILQSVGERLIIACNRRKVTVILFSHGSLNLGGFSFKCFIPISLSHCHKKANDFIQTFFNFVLKLSDQCQVSTCQKHQKRLRDFGLLILLCAELVSLFHFCQS